jgi:hypothetical protein
VRTAPPSGVPALRVLAPRQWWPWGVSGVLLLVVAMMLWENWRSVNTSRTATSRFKLETQPLAVLAHAPAPVVALSPDGQYLAYVAGDDGVGQLYLRPSNSLQSTPVVGADRAHGPFFSPDGKWLAFFASGALKQVSVEGGSAPVWSPDGRELFYQHGESMMAATVETVGGSRWGTPKVLFTGPYCVRSARNFDVSRDGRRFLMIKRHEDPLKPSARSELTVVLNWFEELRQLVPGKK